MEPIMAAMILGKRRFKCVQLKFGESLVRAHKGTKKTFLKNMFTPVRLYRLM